MTRRRALWLIPVLLALHNLEEALTFPRYLTAVRGALAPVAGPLAGAIGAAASAPALRLALGVATLVPLAVVLWAQLRPDSRAALWAALLVQAVVALNVASHLAVAAAVFRGYGPGLATAVLANLPFSAYLFRRAARERWLERRALLALAPAAAAVHGPLLLGLLLLAGDVAAGR